MEEGYHMSVDEEIRNVMDALEGRKRYHATNVKYPYEVNAWKHNFSVVGCDDGTCDHLHFMLKDDEVDVAPGIRGAMEVYWQERGAIKWTSRTKSRS